MSAPSPSGHQGGPQQPWSQPPGTGREGLPPEGVGPAGAPPQQPYGQQQPYPGAPPQGGPSHFAGPTYGLQNAGAAQRAPSGATAANIALYGGVFLVACLTIAKLLAIFDPRVPEGVIVALSVIGLASILLIAAVIVFGHIGLSRSSKTAKGRARSAMALATGYILALLWALRVIAAVAAVLGYGDNFMFAFYYWA